MYSDWKSALAKRSRWTLQMLFVLSLIVTAVPRNTYAQDAQQSSQPAAPAPGQTHPGTANQLAEVSNEAAKNEPDENSAFRYSASVKWFSNLTGMDVQTGYWVFTALNFVIVAWLLIWAWKKSWPVFVRSRNERIVRSLEEARHTSAEAQRRLGDIESRLAKLDSDIAAMKERSGSEAKAEEEQMKAAAVEEKQRILHSADLEIASSAAQARRDLKAFTAEMAIDLARTRIASGIDASSDQELVRDFSSRLGQEGHA